MSDAKESPVGEENDNAIELTSPVANGNTKQDNPLDEETPGVTHDDVEAEVTIDDSEVEDLENVAKEQSPHKNWRERMSRRFSTGDLPSESGSVNGDDVYDLPPLPLPLHHRRDKRKFADTSLDFRPAAARAGLYRRKDIDMPTHFNDDTTFKSLKLYALTKIKLFWKGQSRYAKIHFVIFLFLSLIMGSIIFGIEKHSTSYLDCLFISVSVITGTGLFPLDFSKLHLATKIILLFLCFGGSPLTPVIPITLSIRRHCKGPLPRQALWRLFMIIMTFYVSMILIPFFIYSFYLLAHPEPIGDINPFWFSIFHSISAFTNTGISLLPNGLMNFVGNWLVIPITSIQLIFGYTAIPIALRGCIWLSTFIPKIDKKPSKILLNTPAFAGFLLPKLEAEILALVLFLIIVIGTISNLAVEWSQSLGEFNVGTKFLAALFNDITTRSLGLNTIDFSRNYDVTNLIAIFWMYIAGYPVGVRITETLNPQWLSQMVGFYIKKFLLSGKWWVSMALIVITLAERQRLYAKDDPEFTFFKLLFEVISAYGTVGLSLGYPGIPYSFVGVWTDTSKVALMFVMFIGRHRRLMGTLFDSAHQAEEIGTTTPQENHDVFFV